MTSEVGNLTCGSVRSKVVDYFMLAGPPSGLTALGGLDGRIDSPSFTDGHLLKSLERLEVVVFSALQAPPLVPFVNQAPFAFEATSKIHIHN